MSTTKAEANLERIRAVLRRASCNDGCVFWRDEGQHTNGGCRHLKEWSIDPLGMRRAVAHALHEVRAILEET